MKPRIPRKLKKKLKKQLYPFVIENTWLKEIFKNSETEVPLSGKPLLQAGWGNGYVIIPRSHKLYKPLSRMDYSDIPVLVHGGLTFGNFAKMLGWEEIPKSHEDGYVLGFDTAHYQDNEENWTKEAVEIETLRLKDQISRLNIP